MKGLTRQLLVAAIGGSSVLALPLLGGCEHYHHDRVVAVDANVYEPGYYYDTEYYDPAGHFHNRNYYYYDGHRWDHRDGVPSGFTARARHEAHERHERHVEHW